MQPPAELLQPPPRSEDAVRRICVSQRRAIAFFAAMAAASALALVVGVWFRHPAPLVFGALFTLIALRFGWGVVQTTRRAATVARDGVPAIARLIARGTNGPLSWLDFDLDAGGGVHREARLLMSSGSLPALPSGAELRALLLPDQAFHVYVWIADRGLQWVLAMPAGEKLPEMPRAKKLE